MAVQSSRQYWLTCDQADCGETSDYSYDTAQEAIDDGPRNGWVFDGKWCCGRHHDRNEKG